jgi:hypothetical protein
MFNHWELRYVFLHHHVLIDMVAPLNHEPEECHPPLTEPFLPIGLAENFYQHLSIFLTLF